MADPRTKRLSFYSTFHAVSCGAISFTPGVWVGIFKLSALLPGILFLLAICLQFIPGKLSIGVFESLVDMLLI